MVKKIIVGLFLAIIILFYNYFVRKDNSKSITKLNVNKNIKEINNNKNIRPVFYNYKDGQFTGQLVNAYWGNVQVQAIINNHVIDNINILSYPNSHGTSVFINQQALPILKSEAIKKQSSNIQIISGATFTSEAFIQSLYSALNKAKL